MENHDTSSGNSNLLVRFGFAKPYSHIRTIGPVDIDDDKAKELYKSLKGVDKVPVPLIEEFADKLGSFILDISKKWKQ